MFHRPLLFIAWLALTGCLGSRDDGGGSETTVAGVTGKVVDGAGNPVAGATIRIRPEAALPPALIGAGAGEEPAAGVSLADGSFRVEDLPPGSYLLEVRDLATAGAAVLTARVGAADTLVQLPDAVVRATGAVRGVVRPPQDSLPATLTEVYVYIPGLTSRVLARIQDGLMPFTLADIPAGRYTLRVQAPWPMQLALLGVLEVPNVEIRPGDTADLGNLELPWRASMGDAAYRRDSAAVRTLLDLNEVREEVRRQTMVTGNRITALYEMTGLITRIPKEIAELDRLEVLQLYGRGKEGPPLEVAPEIARVRGLQRVLLHGYAMDTLPDWILAFPELAGLRLQGMGLRLFPVRSASLRFLTSLDLSYNSIAAIPGGISGMKRLRVLDMSENDLTALPPELKGMDGLRGFRARGNRLCDLDAEWKAWLSLQDSLWEVQADPLSFWKNPLDSGWQASQRCSGP